MRACPSSPRSPPARASLVVDGVTGILVDPGDIDGYADALEAYARDPALRARHGAAGLAFAESQDWDHINAAVEKVYARVIERRRRLGAMRQAARWP